MAKNEDPLVEKLGDGETADVALRPNENADAQSLVDAKVPQGIREKYEIYSYRNAAIILSEAHSTEYAELIDALKDFSITTAMIKKAGGQ
jgi:hypothetical protein